MSINVTVVEGAPVYRYKYIFPGVVDGLVYLNLFEYEYNLTDEDEIDPNIREPDDELDELESMTTLLLCMVTVIFAVVFWT